MLGHPLPQMEGESLTRALFRFRSGKTAVFDAMMIDTVFAPDPWWRIIGSLGAGAKCHIRRKIMKSGKCTRLMRLLVYYSQSTLTA